jgi:4-amino-4-deoxy-L-arabinose transferase-like glycosyltransferase
MQGPSLEHAPERAERRGTALVALLSRHLLAVLLALAVAVLAVGTFVSDLVMQDSARDAVMAMRMHYEDDWVHLVKDGADYLDKPHLLFWSAMVGYRLFGVHDWSYRLVSVLVTLLGAWSTYGLGRRLHGETVGRTAAVMFVTAYAIVLGAHDVRMDALLTGFVAFGLWQLVAYLDTGRLRPLVFGAVGIGLAFSAKGLVAVAAAGASVLFHVWARGLWRRLASPRSAIAVGVFLATIAPVLYAYYLQFDAHPEKGVSGVRFILLGQSFERLGGGIGARHPDYLFLWHSLLWAFLPWSLLTYAGWIDRLRALARGRWAAFRAQEQLTFLGPLVAIAVLSFSRYKLAHYLNVFMPMLAVFTASWLEELRRDGRWSWLAALRKVQHVVVAVVLVGALVVVNGWAFPPRSGWIVAGALVFAAVLALALRLADPVERVWVPSAVAISLASFVQNANYVPSVAEHGFGRDDAAELLREDVDWARTYFVNPDEVSHPIQLYTRRVIPWKEPARVRAELGPGEKAFLLVGERGRAEVAEAGLEATVQRRFEDCRVLRMSLRAMNPRNRERSCRPVWLLVVYG